MHACCMEQQLLLQKLLRGADVWSMHEPAGMHAYGASARPARVPIGREYQMAVSTRCINNFHTSGILDTVGGTKFSL